MELPLPALRDRTDDIPPFVDHFLGIFAARYKREKKTVTRASLRRLMDYDWPGNVRQLEHVLLNAWVLSDLEELEPEDFTIPDGYQVSEADPVVASTVALSGAPGKGRARKETAFKHRREEKERIVQALKSCNWNRVKAAEISGIPRRTFYRRLREYGIQ